MATYIVSYTLKHNETANTFVDYWHKFKDETELLSEEKAEEINKNDAHDFYKKLIENDGNEENWHLWTISLSREILGSDEWNK